MKFHAVFFLAGLVTVAGTLASLRRQHIRTEYSVSWLVVGAILTILTGFPWLLNEIARVCGLDFETAFLMVGGALISGLVFEMSHLVSRLRDENVMLAQRIAILEYQLQEFGNRDADRH